MRTLLLAAVLTVALTGCTKSTTVHEVSVQEAQARFAQHAATPCDANDDEYRKVAGWVPGAVRLSNFHEYALSELPADKTRPLVFYCTSRT